MPIRKCLAGMTLVAGILSAQALAGDAGDWLAKRQERFAAWEADNPDIEQRITDLKAASAEKLATYEQRKAADELARQQHMREHWQALTPAQKQEVARLIKQARGKGKAGDCSEVAALYQEALAIDPASVEASSGMGECLRSEGKARQAAAYFTRATESPANDVPSRFAKLGAMMALQDLPPPPDPDIGERPAIFRVDNAPKEVWDAPEAPEMVIIPAGEYTMGAPADEQYYQGRENQHRVTIGYPLAVSKYNITRGEFAAFAADTGYDQKGCDIWKNGTFEYAPNANWKNPGFDQTDEDAVGCITWYDAKAYARWLSKKTGQHYRLPSESELEYAVRGGTTTAYYWGNEIGVGNANCDGCDGPDHEMKSTPGGKFPPNPFGLYDMVGNVWKWMEDCWNPNYDGAPKDGSPWLSGNCALRGKRTGSWFNLAAPRPNDPRAPGRLRSADRFGSIPDLRISSFGFRLVRDL